MVQNAKRKPTFFAGCKVVKEKRTVTPILVPNSLRACYSEKALPLLRKKPTAIIWACCGSAQVVFRLCTLSAEPVHKAQRGSLRAPSAYDFLPKSRFIACNQPDSP